MSIRLPWQFGQIVESYVLLELAGAMYQFENLDDFDLREVSAPIVSA
jgi:hypothetical protein